MTGAVVSISIELSGATWCRPGAERAVGAQDHLVAAVAVHHGARAREQRAGGAGPSTRTQRPNENGSLRSKNAELLAGLDEAVADQLLRVADLAGHRLRRAIVSPTRPRSLASTTLASTRIGLSGFLAAASRGFGFFGSTLGGSITGRGASNGKCAIEAGRLRHGRARRVGGGREPAREAGVVARRGRIELGFERRDPRASAASFASTSGVVTIAVGLGTPEYGIWPVSLTLLKKREEPDRTPSARSGRTCGRGSARTRRVRPRNARPSVLTRSTTYSTRYSSETMPPSWLCMWLRLKPVASRCSCVGVGQQVAGELPGDELVEAAGCG